MKKPWKALANIKGKPNEIISVKRRSDKLTFTIGDQCMLKYVNVPIGKITRMYTVGESWWTELLMVEFGELKMILAGGNSDIIIK